MNIGGHGASKFSGIHCIHIPYIYMRCIWASKALRAVRWNLRASKHTRTVGSNRFSLNLAQQMPQLKMQLADAHLPRAITCAPGPRYEPCLFPCLAFGMSLGSLVVLATAAAAGFLLSSSSSCSWSLLLASFFVFVLRGAALVAQ